MSIVKFMIAANFQTFLLSFRVVDTLSNDLFAQDFLH